ncbi:MAG: hypothetical protein U0271_14060 [Polyangiaceae bacterium]
MDDDEALSLNTLHRFSKRSPRLVLEEYSHCEVPAGCGGVVLRWMDKSGARPCRLEVTTLGGSDVWLDEQRQRSSLVSISPGHHEIWILVTELGQSWALKGRPVVPTPFSVSVRLGANGAGAELLSARDQGAWQWADSAATTPEELRRADPEWLPLSSGVRIADKLHDRQLFGFDRAAQAGRPIHAIGKPGSTSAWVRLAFDLAQEAETP